MLLGDMCVSKTDGFRVLTPARAHRSTHPYPTPAVGSTRARGDGVLLVVMVVVVPAQETESIL